MSLAAAGFVAGGVLVPAFLLSAAYCVTLVSCRGCTDAYLRPVVMVGRGNRQRISVLDGIPVPGAAATLTGGRPR